MNTNGHELATAKVKWVEVVVDHCLMSPGFIRVDLYYNAESSRIFDKILQRSSSSSPRDAGAGRGPGRGAV